MNEACLPPKNDAELRSALEQHLAAIMELDPSRFMAMLAPALVDADFAQRTVRFRYNINSWMLNATDILHGGVLSAMFDNTMGTFARSMTAKASRTLNLQISYAAPVLPDEPAVYIRAQMTSVTNRFAHLYATAWTENGESPVASATGIFYIK